MIVRTASHVVPRPGRAVVVAILATVLTALLPAVPAAAISSTACRVTNVGTGVVRTALAPAVTAAGKGDVLTVRGTCTGGISIAKRIELRGVRPPGAGVPTIVGGALGPVLTIAEEGNVRIRSLTITGGTGTAAGEGHNGGGIYVDGRVVLTSVHVTNNAVDGAGGGIYSFGGTVILGGRSIVDANAANNGGGIEVGFGTLTIGGRTRIADNTASTDGGGIAAGYAALTVNGRAVITGNSAAGRGGGIVIIYGGAAIGGDARITLNEAGALLGAGGGIGKAIALRLARDGATAAPSTPAQLLDTMRAELAKWSKVVKAAGLKMD